MLTEQQLAQLVSQGVSDGAFPKTLFKYRQFNNYTESIFTDNALWFSKPADFNDPFDCKIVDLGNYTSRDIIDYLVVRGMDTPNASSAALRNAVDAKFIPNLLEQCKDEVFDNRGILSLSDCPDSILMWSYYALSHSGFVLGFDVKVDPRFFASLLQVRYVQNYPAFSYLKEPDKIVTHAMASKSECWKHEREYRVVKPKPGLYRFDKKCLSQVIIGYRTNDADRRALINYLNAYGYGHVRLKRAVTSDCSYALRIEDLSIV